MKFRLLPPAAGELRSAARYYEEQIPGLGHDFIQEVRATIFRIIQWPEAWQLLDAEIRRCRTHRFSLRHHLHGGKWRSADCFRDASAPSPGFMAEESPVTIGNWHLPAANLTCGCEHH